ncbi:hypothetical protein CR51_41740 [Caballeronia megalochromosomata]|jgi:integrase/recombinase XerD|nr:hypothetical protein CR51_41740 [Caballeronia megalochromosomata]
MMILNALFSWLEQAGYLAGNPLSLSRQRARHPAPHIKRYLEPSIWQEVKDTMAAMVAEDTAESGEITRSRIDPIFSFLSLYTALPRILFDALHSCNTA